MPPVEAVGHRYCIHNMHINKIKSSGEAKLFLGTETSQLSEMMRS
jgi:hypothetical protein